MRIALAADHAGFDLKQDLVAWLRDSSHEVVDLGTHGPERVDYPRYGFLLGESIASGDAEFGIAICGSGIGISIAANRHPAVRCALVSDPLSARLARAHNDANAIALGARLIGPDMARACVTEFLAGPFEGGRHAERVAMLSRPPFAEESA